MRSAEFQRNLGAKLKDLKHISKADLIDEEKC